MVFELRVVSFNVGTPFDWENIMTRATYSDVIYDSSVAHFSDEERKHWQADFEDKVLAIRNNAVLKTAHQEHTVNYFEKIIQEFHPSLFCLQEYFGHDHCPNREYYERMRNVLQKNGFMIIGESDSAIAYSKHAFRILSEPYYTYDPLKNRIGCNKPALFVDLKHQESGQIVRVISDHLPGFNGRLAKQAKAVERSKKEKMIKKSLPDTHEERIAEIQKRLDSHVYYHKALGDGSLELSLYAVHSRQLTYHKSIADHILELFSVNTDQTTPAILIYGLDANTTAKSVSENKNLRLHPKRLRLFEKYHFQFDSTSNRATIIDSQDGFSRKYDYISAKSCKDFINISIQDYTLKHINEEEMLTRPSEMISDHLPVLSQINFRICKEQK